MKDRTIPKIDALLVTSNLEFASGSWVMLDGSFRLTDADTHKAINCQVQHVIMPTSSIALLQKSLANGGVLRQYHRELPSIYYTFVGEAGWSDTFPVTNRETLEVVVGTKVVKDKFPSADYGLGVGNRPASWKEPITEKFSALIPVVGNGWESHHSTTNEGYCPPLLAREISAALKLHVNQQSSEYYTATGELASLVIKSGKGWGSHQEFVYLRKDLYDNLLKTKHWYSLWIIWCQRELYAKNHDAATKLYAQHGIPQELQEIQTYVPPKRRGHRGRWVKVERVASKKRP
jgi:hypothetical protein